MDLLLAVGVSTAVIFVAEMGDKTQLVAMSLAARYRFLPVLTGVVISSVAIYGISVFVAEALGLAMPTTWLTLLAGTAFLGFGLWTLRTEEHPAADERRPARPSWGSALLTATVVSFVAELGDKSMLATVAVATQYHWLLVWIGATLGMVMASVLAILLGATLHRRLPERVLQVGSAVVFFLAGVAMLGQASYILLS